MPRKLYETVSGPSGNDPRLEPAYSSGLSPVGDQQTGTRHKMDLIPAIQVGGKLYTGEKGQYHSHIISDIPDDLQQGLHDDHLGYVDMDTGKFHTKAELGIESQSLKQRTEELIQYYLDNGLYERSLLNHSRGQRRPKRLIKPNRIPFAPTPSQKQVTHYPEREVLHAAGRTKFQVMHPHQQQKILKTY